MMLRRLCEFADHIPELPPSMYSPLQFKWQVDLDERGRFQTVVPLSDGTNTNRGLRMYAPNRKRSGTSPPPLLLADKANYSLGVGAPSPGESWHFTQFRDLVAECAESTREPAVEAVASFLESHEAAPVRLPQDLGPGDLVVFRVGDIRPIDLKSVQAFWARKMSSGDGDTGHCLVCGSRGPVDRVSPIAIKGIPGGQSSGMALVSANKDAFESYGATQALIAPTCRACGEAYANAINYMLRNDRHHVNVGPTAFIFWTAGATDFSPATFISQPQEEDVKNLIGSYRTGRLQYGLQAEAFYALSLSASASRVVVRDWLDTTIPEAQSSLARWFLLQRIADPFSGEIGKPYGVYPLAASLYVRANEQMVANVPRALVRCALHAGPLPTWLLAQAVGRNRAEQDVTRPRAALIKAVMLSQMEDFEEGYMEELDITCKSPGYLCGRLLAVLEAAQRVAINPRATLVDHYYGAASSAPATVFGYLMRDFQVAHLAKLRKNKPKVYYAIDSRMQDILRDLGDFPRTLTLKEQALFSLGYYHQKAAYSAQARERAELKELETPEEAEE